MFYHDLLLPKISEGLLCLFGGEIVELCQLCGTARGEAQAAQAAQAFHVVPGKSTSQDATGKVDPESQCIGDDTSPALDGRSGIEVVIGLCRPVTPNLSLR